MDLSGLLMTLGGLAAKYGGLAVEAVNTMQAAMRGELSAEEVQAEIDRIKAAETNQVAEDWKTVQG